MGLGQRHQMLAAAEAALHPDVLDRAGEERARIGRQRRKVDGEPRQQVLDGARLPEPQGLALATAVEGPLAGLRGGGGIGRAGGGSVGQGRTSRGGGSAKRTRGVPTCAPDA